MSAARSTTLGEGSARALYALVGQAVHGAVAAVAKLRGRAGASTWLDERLGRYASGDGAAGNRASIWVHAASVGEVRAVEALVARLRDRFGASLRIVVTCQTATGRALAARIGADEVRFAPLDSERAVSRALGHFAPALFILVETEIWPRLLGALARASVPSAMVSARVSARSFARYRLARGLFAPQLAALARVCARDAESADRLVALGARADATTVCGDLKLDALDAETVGTTPAALPPTHGPRQLLAISTHSGEEAVVLDAFARIRSRQDDVCLVLAPRHPERRAEVLALVEPRFRSALWSSGSGRGGTPWDVLVLDTTGELRGFLKTATAGFVGGSLVPIGGHNLAEPAAFRVPVATGPQLANVEHQVELLRRNGSLIVVRDANELARAWSRWLDDPAAARQAGDAAHEAIAAGVGALERTLAALEPCLARLERHTAELR